MVASFRYPSSAFKPAVCNVGWRNAFEAFCIHGNRCPDSDHEFAVPPGSVAAGENAWLVEPGNPKVIAEAVSYLLKEPEVACSSAARAREDAQAYTLENQAASILTRLR